MATDEAERVKFNLDILNRAGLFLLLLESQWVLLTNHLLPAETCALLRAPDSPPHLCSHSVVQSDTIRDS